MTLLAAWGALALMLVHGVAAAGEVTAQLHIAKRRIDGNSAQVLRVKVGDTVELRWTTDEATTIHVHGYAIERALSPEAPMKMRFDASATGRFPVSAHGFAPGTPTGTNRESILMYIEVYPR